MEIKKYRHGVSIGRRILSMLIFTTVSYIVLLFILNLRFGEINLRNYNLVYFVSAFLHWIYTLFKKNIEGIFIDRDKKRIVIKQYRIIGKKDILLEILFSEFSYKQSLARTQKLILMLKKGKNVAVLYVSDIGEERYQEFIEDLKNIKKE